MAQKDDIKVRFSAGSTDITPQRPLPLAGYANRKGNFEHVADTLEANAVLLSDGDVRVAIVAVDLLYVGAALRQDVLDRLHGALPDQSLFFAASHTHFAPATSTQLPGLGEVDRDYVSFAA